jgi:hypothetical protein
MVIQKTAHSHLSGGPQMSQKSDLYNALKASGHPLSTTYALYTVDQLQAELAFYQVPVVTIEEKPEPEAPVTPEEQAVADQYARFDTAQTPAPAPRPQDPEEMPGQRLNTKAEDEPIRVDEQGRLWYQEEVLKPAYPKPRGRRVLTYMDRGVVTETVQNGEYIETFEVAGKGAGKPAEVKITLPSYQVGIYKDPRFPFRIHCYNGREGFNLFEVAEYFGGTELVPEECKRVYIENDLCYDIRTVIRAIQTEYRQLQLTGRVK